MKQALYMNIFLILGAVIVTGCNSPGCLVEGKIVEVATNVTASKLQCKNVAAVENSMKNLVENLKLCTSAQKTGPIADTFCPLITNAVVEFIAAKGIPAEWECSAINAKTLLKDALTSACKQIPVSK